MASFNKVILMGNLTRDPQLRYLPNNTAVCEFGLAMDRKWRDSDGNQKEDVCFVDVSAFGRSGEVLNQYMTKGQPVLVEGHLRFSSWTGQDGQKRSKLSVVVDSFRFVGSRGDQPAGTSYDRGRPPSEPPGPDTARPPGPDAAHPPDPVDAPAPAGDDIPF